MSSVITHEVGWLGVGSTDRCAISGTDGRGIMEFVVFGSAGEVWLRPGWSRW